MIINNYPVPDLTEISDVNVCDQIGAFVSFVFISGNIHYNGSQADLNPPTIAESEYCKLRHWRMDHGWL